MLSHLTTQQKGRCGELLVQYVLLKHGIESAPLTTDTGIDLVAYPRVSTKSWSFDRPATIQVKTSTHRGESDKWIEWSLSEDCPADYVATVDLERDKFWFFPVSEFKRVSTKSGAYCRLWWCPPSYEYEKDPRREKDFAKYEMDEGIRNAFS